MPNLSSRRFLVVVLLCAVIGGCGDRETVPVNEADASQADIPDAFNAADLAMAPDGAVNAGDSQGTPTSDGPASDLAPITADARPGDLSALCVATGGQVTSGTCCATVQDFPNTCLGVGTCGCSPSNSHPVKTCACPASRCFTQENGCVDVKSCTPGSDQTCNENPIVSALRGHCNPDMTCTCVTGSVRNPASGKCS